jgi:hypothetical protein
MVPVAGEIDNDYQSMYLLFHSNGLSCGCKFRLMMLDFLDWKVEDEL